MPTESGHAPRGRGGARELVVVLVRPEGAINVGSVARLCSNVGAHALRLVQPRVELDEPVLRQFAASGGEVLERMTVHASLADAVRDCELVLGTAGKRRLRGLVPHLAPHELGDLLVERAPRRLAIVFGNERAGLDNEELERCQAYVWLETPGPNPSFNLSHAAAVVLYFAAVTAPKPSPKRRAATQAELDGLYDAWLALLHDAGFFRRMNAARFAPKVRALWGRLALTGQDVALLRSMVGHLGLTVREGARTVVER